MWRERREINTRNVGEGKRLVPTRIGCGLGELLLVRGHGSVGIHEVVVFLRLRVEPVGGASGEGRVIVYVLVRWVHEGRMGSCRWTRRCLKREEKKKREREGEKKRKGETMKENKRRGVADSRLRSREREPSAGSSPNPRPILLSKLSHACRKHSKGARLIVQTILSFSSSSSSASSAPSPPSSPPPPNRPSAAFHRVRRRRAIAAAPCPDNQNH